MAMPEFEALLSFAQKIRLVIGLRRPDVIGRLMAEVANDYWYDRAKVMEIYRTVEDAVEDHYGEEGLEQFRRAFDRFAK
jgi:hypothetical protein